MIDIHDTTLSAIEDRIDHVTKRAYCKGKLARTMEYTTDAYMSEWHGILYDKVVRGVKGIRVSHAKVNITQSTYVLTRYQDGPERWDYEIHWKS